MITKNLLLTCLSFFILVYFLQTSDADRTNPSCSPSACGILHNISFPFRLKDDPKHCGDPNYELSCENNVTTIYLNSQQYHVKAISYNNQTIRLVDASIKANSCSFPKYSAYWYNFSYNYPYSIQNYYRSGDSSYIAWPINFVSCPYKLINSSLLKETTDCTNRDNSFHASNSSNNRHTYIMVGAMEASEVKYMCRVDLIVMTSWKYKDFKNVSLSEIHESLLYGFELSWLLFKCRKCKGRFKCDIIEEVSNTCGHGNWLHARLDAVLEHIKYSPELGPLSGPPAVLVLFVLLVLGAL